MEDFNRVDYPQIPETARLQEELPTPESLVRQFSAEQVIGLFEEMGYSINAEDAESILRSVLTHGSVELAFQHWIQARGHSQ